MNSSDTEKLFARESIDIRQPAAATIQIQAYLNFFNARRLRYNNTNRVIASIDPKKAVALSQEYQDFNNGFNEIIRKVDEALKANAIQQAVDNLEMFNETFQRMESMYNKYENEYKNFPAELAPAYRALQSEYQEMVQHLHVVLENSRSELFGKIQQGIDNLLQIKRELGVTGTFKGKIEGEIKKAKIISVLYLLSFIGILILIPVLLIITFFFMPEFSKLEWHEAFVIRLSIAAPLVWIATLLNKNYTLRRVAAMKFDHLDRLLGGGAATIADLVKSDNTAQAEVYKRLSELFLDIKDLSEIASHETRPKPKAIKEALEILKDVKITLKND